MNGVGFDWGSFAWTSWIADKGRALVSKAGMYHVDKLVLVLRLHEYDAGNGS